MTAVCATVLTRTIENPSPSERVSRVKMIKLTRWFSILSEGMNTWFQVAKKTENIMKTIKCLKSMLLPTPAALFRKKTIMTDSNDKKII